MSFKKRVCAISNVAAVWSRPSRGLMTGTAGRRSIFPKISTMPSHIAGMTVGELFRNAKNEFVSGASPIDEVSSARMESLRNSHFPQHRAHPLEPQWELHHDPVEVLQHTKAWVDGMVVGLRLCPFTRNADLAGVPPGHMRYEVSTATTIAGMHADACDSIGRFVDTEEEEVAALMVVFPQFTSDFLRFAVFTEVMQSFLTKVRFIQGLHFHPSYEFPTAGGSPEDMQFHEDTAAPRTATVTAPRTPCSRFSGQRWSPELSWMTANTSN